MRQKQDTLNILVRNSTSLYRCKLDTKEKINLFWSLFPRPLIVTRHNDCNDNKQFKATHKMNIKGGCL